MIRRPPRSTPFPTRRSSDLAAQAERVRGLSLKIYDALAPGAERDEDVDRLVLEWAAMLDRQTDRKSTRLNSSHGYISYAVFCLKKKKNCGRCTRRRRSRPPS